MKKILQSYLILILLLTSVSCKTHHHNGVVNLIPEKKTINSINISDSNTVEFLGLKFSKEGSDSIFDSLGVKIIFDTSRSVLILESHFDEIIKKIKISNHKLSHIMRRNKVTNHFELMKLIYSITPNSEINDKELFLDLKEIMIQNGVENGFYELDFDWDGKGFQYGKGGSEHVSIELFNDGHLYMILFRNFTKEQLEEFLSKISPSKEIPNL